MMKRRLLVINRYEITVLFDISDVYMLGRVTAFLTKSAATACLHKILSSIIPDGDPPC